jgi:hypothetical protein
MSAAQVVVRSESNIFMLLLRVAGVVVVWRCVGDGAAGWEVNFVAEYVDGEEGGWVRTGCAHVMAGF